MVLNNSMLLFSQSGMPRRGRDSEEEGGASRKRQRPGGSVQDAEGRSRGLEQSRSILDPVTLSFSLKCDATALAGRRDALEAALKKVATEFEGLDFRMGRTIVGPSDETLQKILPLVLEHVGVPGVAAGDFVWPFLLTCRAWRRELEARGFCRTTWQLCSTLAARNVAARNNDDAHDREMRRICARLARTALQRLSLSLGTEGNLELTPSSLLLDANAFLQRSWGWGATTVHEYLQAASQEPDASFLSRGAVSTAQILGLPLVRWAGKPQGRYPGLCSLDGHWSHVRAVAFSADGTRVVSGSNDGSVKVWNADTGAEVCKRDRVFQWRWSLFPSMFVVLELISSFVELLSHYKVYTDPSETRNGSNCFLNLRGFDDLYQNHARVFEWGAKRQFAVQGSSFQLRSNKCFYHFLLCGVKTSDIANNQMHSRTRSITCSQCCAGQSLGWCGRSFARCVCVCA